MEYTSIIDKGQTTIPADICRHLGVKEGDKIAFEVESNGMVCVKKLSSTDTTYLHAVATSLAEEWLSPEDCKAYDNL